MASAKLAQTSAVSALSLKLDQLEEDPANARLTFDPDALQRLADSLAAQGQLQPVLVRLMPNGVYRIVDGHRRVRAAKLAKLGEVRCELVELTDSSAALAAATANLQREDLTPYEEARAYRSIIELLKASGQKSNVAEVARLCNVAHNTVKHRLELLDLPESVGARIGDNGFSIQHAQALLPFKESPVLFEAAEKFVAAAKELPDAEELPGELIQHLGEKGLVRTKYSIPKYWNLGDKLDASLEKVPHIRVKDGHREQVLYTDQGRFAIAVKDAEASVKMAAAKARAKNSKEDAPAKGPSLEAQAKRGLRNVQAELMAGHVARLGKWNDELEVLLIESFLAGRGMPARQKDQELLEQACGLTELQILALGDEGSVAKMWRSKRKELLRYVAGQMFFANQGTHHEMVGDKYEALFYVEDPAAKLLTGQTYDKTLNALKELVKSEKAKKAADAPKGDKCIVCGSMATVAKTPDGELRCAKHWRKADKKPKPGKTAPKAAAKPKAKGKAKPAAKKPVKETAAVAKARAKLAQRGKQATLPKAAGLELVVEDAAVAAQEPVQA